MSAQAPAGLPIHELANCAAVTVQRGANVCCVVVDPAGFAFGFGEDRVLAFDAAAAAFSQTYGRKPQPGRGHAHFINRPRLLEALAPRQASR